MHFDSNRFRTDLFRLLLLVLLALPPFLLPLVLLPVVLLALLALSGVRRGAVGGLSTDASVTLGSTVEGTLREYSSYKARGKT